MNAKDMLDLLRDNINEATAAHWTDVNLMRRLNNGQRKWALKVAMAHGQWLLKSESVTPVASVITLPSDCSKPVYMEETSSGDPISWLESVIHRRVSRETGTTLDLGAQEAYPLRATLEVNRASYTEPCTLWYQIRVPDLVAGTASAGAATSLTFADDRIAKHVADYYNGVSIEIVSGTGTAGLDTISAYTAARVCTVTGTYSSSTVFGTISMLPEETHPVIVLEATLSALHKPSAELDKESRNNYASELREMRKEVTAWLEGRVSGSSHVAIGDDY